MDPWIIERLATRHDPKMFSCGVASLDDWLRRAASQYDRRNLARTYVAAQPQSSRVFGYYAVSNHRVEFEALPADQAKGLLRIDVPVVLLGRLAVDRTMQGQGLGSLLLIDALRRIVHVANELGVRAVAVHAIDDNARNFYLHYGFVPLRDDLRHLFLPLDVVRKLNLPPL